MPHSPVEEECKRFLKKRSEKQYSAFWKSRRRHLSSCELVSKPRIVMLFRSREKTGGMVLRQFEGAALEKQYSSNRIEGSNPLPPPESFLQQKLYFSYDLVKPLLFDY